MLSNIAANIFMRIHDVAARNSFPDWYIDELCGHDKGGWYSDLRVEVTNPKNPVEKIWKSFRMTRIWHRRPSNTWIYGGGWRYHPNVTPAMMEGHAIEMSLKAWIMGIPHGGAKGGIAFDPRSYSRDDIRAITIKAVDKAIEHRCIGPLTDRWAPDIGTNEEIMACIQEHYSHESNKHEEVQPAACVTGKPVNTGGILGRKEATGRGLQVALRVFRQKVPIILPEHPTVILQGFGNVGYHFAQFCTEFGLKIIGVLDQYGGVYHPDLPLADLLAYVSSNPLKTVAGFHTVCGGDELKNDKELFSIPADIAVPAALEETITPDIASLLKIKVLLEAANTPTVPEADSILADRGIIVIPDIYANSGGFLVSYFEWEQDTHRKSFDLNLIPPPRYPDTSLVFAAMQSAFFRNGEAIIDIKQKSERAGHQVDYRLASYMYALERVLPIYATKRGKI